MSNPFGNVDIRSLFVQPYGSQLWTIPVEYRGSFVVFLTLLCLSKVHNSTRIALLCGLIIYTMWLLHWDISLFLMGTLFADLSLADPSSLFTHLSGLLSSLLPRLPKPNSVFLTATITTTFILGLFLLCYPDENAAVSPGYASLVSSVPAIYTSTDMQDKYWLCIGSFLLVGSIACSPALQRPFTTPVAQYLARISFALYLVHPLFLHTIGMRMLYRVLEPPEGWTPGEEAAQGNYVPSAWVYGVTALQAAVLCTSLSIWLSDWVWRCVDAKAVSFARWVSELVWIKE